MRQHGKYVFGIIVIFLLAINGSIAAGIGSGGNNPLTLETSSPQANAVDVELDHKIELQFSNNVINANVRDGNQACFSLADAGGKVIAIDILMANDMVEPNKKEIVFIKPLESLEANTTYVLTISGDLTAKTGDRLGKDIKLSFTTAKVKEPPYTLLLIGAVLVAAVYSFVFKKE